MSYFIGLFSLCAAINSFDPPGKNNDLSGWQKRKACEYSSVIIAEATKNDIDPHLYIALILVESGFNKRAVSNKGACGLTQVLPKYTGGIANKKKYTCEQLKNPRISIATGAEILKYWIHTYAQGDERVGLCGYNAGFRCKITKNRKRPHKAGMRYANKVLMLKRHFSKSLR